MSYPSAVTTERLDLCPVDPVADLDALGRLFADPEGWWYDPAGLDKRHQGRGYATELGQAAMEAAAFVDADAAFIAWAAEHNTPSRRVAERLGLVDRGLRIDASDGTPRLARRPPPRRRPHAPAPRLIGMVLGTRDAGVPADHSYILWCDADL